MSNTNPKYKRLESLLSAKSLEPDPAPGADEKEVKALKARVASLEAALEENHIQQFARPDSVEPEAQTPAVPKKSPRPKVTRRAASDTEAEGDAPAITTDEQRHRSMILLTVFMACMAFFAVGFYFVLYLQTGVWQILAESFFILSGIVVLLGVSYPLIRRYKYRAASTWMMVALTLAYATPELVWSNATLYLLLTGMLLLFMVGTVFPPQPMAWWIVTNVYMGIIVIANIAEPLPRFDINQSPVLEVFIPGVTIVIATWMAGQLTLGLIRMVRSEKKLEAPGSPFRRAFTRLLLAPDETVIGVEDRKLAQLLTSILAVVFPLYLVGQLFRSNDNSNLSLFMANAGIAMALLASYGLSRTNLFRSGAFLTVLALTATIYGSYTGSTSGWTEYDVIQPILWLSLPIIVSSFILPFRVMVVYLVLNTIALVSLAYLPDFPTRPILPATAVVVITSFSLSVGRRFRDRVEGEIRGNLISANEELEASESLSQTLTQNLFLVAEVTRRLSQIRDLSEMLTEAAELIRSNFDLYYVQVYLVNPARNSLILKAGTGSVGEELLRRNHRLILDGSSINGRAAGEKRPVVVDDTTKSTFFRPNPLLPDTRSEMTIPLMIGDILLGVLDLQSLSPGALNEEILPSFQSLAGQLAIAIQNSQLFYETERARTELEIQARRLARQGWSDYLNAIQKPEWTGFVFDHNQILPLSEAGTVAPSNGNSFSLPLEVTGEPIGALNVELDTQAWTSEKKELVQSVARQVAQQVDNLRLLENAERYRAEAENVMRRMTLEGWERFAGFRQEKASGYMYDLEQVLPLQENSHQDRPPALTQPLSVRDETIGQLAVENEMISEEDREIMEVVAAQLSAHIENLRLLESTQYELAERKRAEQDLLKMRLGMDRATDAVFITDTEGTIIYCNPAFEKVYGWNPEEAIGQNPRIIKSGLIPQEQYKAFWGALTSKQVVAGEIVNKTRDGRLIPIEASNSPIVDSDGTIIGFLGVHRDITERKQAQEALTKRATELQTVAQLSATTSTVLDPQRLLQTVVDLTKDSFGVYHTHIYLTDDEAGVLSLSVGAGEAGKKMVDQTHTIPMDAKQSLVARAARERQAVIVNDVQADAGFLPNPLLPETRSELAVPMIVGGRVLGVFDVQSDQVEGFTEEDANIYTTLASQVGVALQNARLYVEQAATVNQLRELDRLKSSFLANMSHELRTPLNSILGFADVMLEELDGPLTDNMQNDLGLIQKNGQHLLHLINDVLDMAKIEAGRMNLDPEKFRLHEILEEVTSITSTMANDKKIALQIEKDSDRKVEITADRTRIRQVMINLVNNSIKFTEKGSVSIHVSNQNEHVLIKVRDTGIGIPADKLEDVFKEFAQLDASTTRKTGGTGLGLPISRRLIEMHGGRLWAESSGKQNKGSTFYVELPLVAQISETLEQVAK